MAGLRPRDIASRIAPWLAGAVLSVPLFVVRHPPMTDLPLHEGMVALLRHARFASDASLAPPGLYRTAFGHANQLFYLLAYPLSVVLGARLACVAVVALAIVATFVAAARLADHVGATRWAALLVTPAVMGWTFFWGFAPNMLGLALFLAALPELDRFAESPTVSRAAKAVALVVLLHFAHEASLMSACVAVVVLALARPLGAKTAVRLLPLAVGAALLFFETRLEAAHMTAFAKGWVIGGATWHGLGIKAPHLVDFLLGGLDGVEQAVLVALVAIAVTMFVLDRRAAKAVDEHEEHARSATLSTRIHDHRFVLVAAALFVLYWALPYKVNFGAYLYVRFLAPAYCIAIVAFAPRVARPIARALCAALPLAWILVATPQLSHSDREARDLEPLFAKIAPASAWAVLRLGGDAADQAVAYTPTSVGNLVLTERGGRGLHTFAEYPVAPVVIAPEYEWSEPVFRLYVGRPSELRPEHDLSRFRFLLVRILDDALADLVARALVPDATLVASSGRWFLFESTHATVPLTSPDAPLPRPAPPSLQKRVDAILGK